jgi:uncharacterized protein
MTNGSLVAKFGSLALITGASEGIGQATAHRFAALGFNLLIVARGRERLEALARELRSRHSVAIEVICADLSREEGRTAVLHVLAEREPRLTVLAAGYGSSGNFADQDIGEEVDLLEVNCRAVLELCHALSAVMKGSGGGQIESVPGCSIFE